MGSIPYSHKSGPSNRIKDSVTTWSKDSDPTWSKGSTNSPGIDAVRSSSVNVVWSIASVINGARGRRWIAFSSTDECKV